ncbi:DUF4112 domain-containing protein (plasmid) [Rhizobium sp. Pop5]|uniref:DUF4112 domain-containing protein n=1 Tax=Rhizobium sp. Pop5 TaxID=1223565 RepID=UPI0002838690|nr:DUF4112 domain-containing protein [Rhizobium sp. Pop5]EJZ18759.1 hypothetical protein RCCGEPOP_23892 [Rhizobium sp. Pop5]UVD60577.1 DUF4112 domain-containing protein [Rhizobium sp. Pop5]
MQTSAGTKRLTSIERERIRRAVRIARLMDTAVRLPIIGVRIGADSVLGLIPAVGDVAASLIGLYLINEARHLGVPNHKLARMAVNLGIDAAGGTVPLIGDLFDIYFKSHRRNAGIILEHFGLKENELDRL